ncbi:MAG: hypothetical protein ABJD68_20555 [Nakamurella sp.]
MAESIEATCYVGQVEMDPTGILWAVLYHGETVVTREQVRSLRKGKRRVADLVLSAADSVPAGFRRSAPTHLNRIATQPSRPRRRHVNVAAV